MGEGVEPAHLSGVGHHRFRVGALVDQRVTRLRFRWRLEVRLQGLPLGDDGSVRGCHRFAGREPCLNGPGLLGKKHDAGCRGGVERGQVGEHHAGGDEQCLRPPVPQRVKQHARQGIRHQYVAGPQQDERIEEAKREQQKLPPVIHADGLRPWPTREDDHAGAEQHGEERPHRAFGEEIHAEEEREVNALGGAVRGGVRVRLGRQPEGQDVHQQDAEQRETAHHIDGFDALRGRHRHCRHAGGGGVGGRGWGRFHWPWRWPVLPM